MKNICEKLGIEIESPFFDEAYNKALKSKNIPNWLAKEYILRLNEEWDVFPKFLDKILLALDKVLENPDLVIFAKTLYYIIDLSPTRAETFKKLDLPLKEGDENEIIGYNLVTVFPIIGHMRRSFESLIKRGIAEKHIKATFKFLDGGINASSKRMKFISYNDWYFRWGIRYLYEELLRIEHFEFEILPHYNCHARVFENKNDETIVLADGVTIHRDGHILGTAGYKDEEGSFKADFKETDEYFEGCILNKETSLYENKRVRLPKNEWRVILKDGDSVIGLHIPASIPLDDDICRFSFDKAEEVLTRCYPEYSFKAFETFTWLLAPELKTFLKPQSNILNFRKYFTIFPSERASGMTIFSYVYLCEDVNIDYNLLSEETSLQRSIKKHYLEGKYVHEFNGFFMIGKLKKMF